MCVSVCHVTYWLFIVFFSMCCVNHLMAETGYIGNSKVCFRLLNGFGIKKKNYYLPPAAKSEYNTRLHFVQNKNWIFQSFFYIFHIFCQIYRYRTTSKYFSGVYENRSYRRGWRRIAVAENYLFYLLVDNSFYFRGTTRGRFVEETNRLEQPQGLESS